MYQPSPIANCTERSHLSGRSKFGPFHADREYVYARRVWERPSDGGCYALSLPCTHPKADLDSRAVLVRDHVSAFVVRAVPSVQGLAEGAHTLALYPMPYTLDRVGSWLAWNTLAARAACTSSQEHSSEHVSSQAHSLS